MEYPRGFHYRRQHTQNIEANNEMMTSPKSFHYKSQQPQDISTNNKTITKNFENTSK